MSALKLNRQRLIACREKLGITKQETARRIKLSQPAYLRYESGDRTPSIHVIHAMAEVLGTSASYLLDETDDPSPDSFTVTSQADPELFQIVRLYKSDNSDQKEHLKSYLEKYLQEAAPLS